MYPKKSPSKLTYAQGNTFMEYALVGLLVLGVCILTLLKMNVNLSNSVQRMMGSKPVVSNTMAVTHTPPTDSTTTAATVTPVPNIVQLTTDSGTVINLMVYPQNLSSSIMTSGAHGTTDLLADTIISLAQQLLAAKEISQTGYDSLMALANQGHRIASIEKLQEDVAASASSPQQYANTLIQFEGKTYTPDTLMNLIGYNNNSMDPNAVQNPLTDPTADPEIQTLQTLYQEAVQSGVLNDPVVAQVVENLAGQIGSLSDDTNIAVATITENAGAPKNMEQTVSSIAANNHSASICTIGSSKDSGVKCTGG